MNNETLLNTMAQAIIDGDSDACRLAAQEAMQAGMDPALVISKGLMKGIEEVGLRFGSGEFFLPELLLGAKAMQAGIDVVNPVITAMGGTREIKGKVLLGVVKGDIHTIGKDIIASVFNVYGFHVIDLGADVPDDRFMTAVREHRPDILGVSALMTITMVKQRDVIQRLAKEGLRDQVKVLVGGAVCNPEWAQEIGADGYAPDAWSAVELAARLIGK